MKKILIVSQYFWPENFKINDLVFKLKDKYNFTILTGKPNYPEGKIYSNFKSNEIKFNKYYNAKIHRIFTIARGKSKTQLAINYINFILSASIYSLIYLRKKKFDLIFICGFSPIFSAIPGIILKKINKSPIILWVLDLWPDTLMAMSNLRSKVLIKILNLSVNRIYKNCDLILAQSKGMVKKISTRIGEKKKIIYFPTWSEDIFKKKKSIKSIYKKEKGFLTILFAGNLGEAQDIELIFKCALNLIKQNKKIKWIFVGQGRKFIWLKNEIKKNDVNFFFHIVGKKPLNMMPQIYNMADIFLVSLKNEKVFKETVPGKMQSYMMYGKPILGLVGGDSKNLILDTKCGFVAKPGSYKNFIYILNKIIVMKKTTLNKMGQNGKKFALKNFDSNISMLKLESHFKNLL
tara:strand:- start:3251 stop:4465 length:1215 start_codon:yes stop_codon:yes gene_type:complete